MEIKDFKVVIDLKDLYSECGECDYNARETDFNEVLKGEIERKVIDSIIRGFTLEVVNKLKEETLSKFREAYEQKIGERIEKAIERGIFVKPDGKTFNVDAYAMERLEQAVNAQRTFSQTIDRKVKERVENIVTELEARYDMEFASAIIKNLKDGNLLKEGAEKLLLK